MQVDCGFSWKPIIDINEEEEGKEEKDQIIDSSYAIMCFLSNAHVATIMNNIQVSALSYLGLNQDDWSMHAK